jgi:hypothetical protein
MIFLSPECVRNMNKNERDNNFCVHQKIIVHNMYTMALIRAKIAVVIRRPFAFGLFGLQTTVLLKET